MPALLPLSPGAPADVEGDVFRFDEKRAERAVQFIEKICVHTKGRFAKQPFLLDDWQADEIVRPIFGTVRYDDQYGEWVRQYRIAWIELARKNGKSELLSAFALLGLVGDDEESAEVYSVAADRDQAALVFNTAKRMVELSPVLSKRLIIVDSQKRIIDPKTNSIYKVLPGDAAGALGTNPSMVLFDEVLTQRDRHLWDAMRQGFGTRKQPILIAATTAAYTSAAFALEEHEHGQRVLADPALDPDRFVFMRNVPKDADWLDEGKPADPGTGEPGTGWYWANPALGTFLSLSSLRGEAREAQSKPTAQNAFRVFRLNQWVSQESRWLDMAVWDGNAEPVLPPETLRERLAGRRAIGGLDLASTRDFTAWVLLFPGTLDDPAGDGFTVLPHFWIPRPMVEERSQMKTQFEVWERDGLVTVTDGPVTDYDAIEAHIGRDAEQFNLKVFGYDPWNATQVVGHLEEGGLTGVKVPQTGPRLTDPCKAIESALAEHSLYHAGNPVLRWMGDNVQLEITGDGLMKPSKKKSGDKIDGIAALVNAVFVAAIPEVEEAVVEFISFDDTPVKDGGPDELDAFNRAWHDDDDDW